MPFIDALNSVWVIVIQINSKYIQEGFIWEVVDRRLAYNRSSEQPSRMLHRRHT
jgi:hypothetical protein